jgi:putative transposase
MIRTPPIQTGPNLRHRAFSLPRLPREYYQGDAVVHWTLTTFDRAKGWLTPAWHIQFRELMFHAAAREGLLCPIYCVLPDHLHLVWMGLRRDSDQFKGMAFLRTHLEPTLQPARFQPQPQDSVLLEKDRRRAAFARVCGYVARNPVRAELLAATDSWPYTGCVIPGYPTLQPMAETFWPTFWKIDPRLTAADAGHIKRPALK